MWYAAGKQWEEDPTNEVLPLEAVIFKLMGEKDENKYVNVFLIQREKQQTPVEMLGTFPARCKNSIFEQLESSLCFKSKPQI